MTRLEAYHGKRDFEVTPEPRDGGRADGLAPVYSMQNHDATRLHWDLRLEYDGVLLSWAITRGPSLDPADKRLAVQTEDHPMSYLDFEGTIPKGNYGAGTVMLWDVGHWQPLSDVAKGLKKGHLSFVLHGLRMTGRWDMIRLKPEGKRVNWLLVKHEDAAAHGPDPVKRYTTSVATRRTMDAIAEDAPTAPPPPRKTALPRWRQPQLATLTDRLGDPEQRWHELKFDGYRALVAVGKGGARIYTRNGHDWTDRFLPLVPAFEELPCDAALIDGEITVGAGLYGFGRLQKAIKLGGPFHFHAFDLLKRDGEDLTGLPLTNRRAALEELFTDTPPLGLLQLSPVLRGDASDAFDRVCHTGGEGLISKRMDAPYRGGRSTAWEKIKCIKRDEFVVIGWQDSDKKGRPFASLALGIEEAGEMVYAGKIGTGWDADTMDEIAARLKPLARKTAPAPVPAAEARGMNWVTPRLVVEVRYAEVTEDGRLRHPSFEGLREDKPADQVRRDPPTAALETAAETKPKARGSAPAKPQRSTKAAAVADAGDKRATTAANGRVTIAGISLSSPDRRVFPQARHTKRDVAEYYARAADRMLRFAGDRPLSLVRLPEGLEGERFFQKHAGKGFPDAIRTVEIAEKSGAAEYMTVRDAAGLVGAVQMGTIEFHIWGARNDRVERPDRMVFDLDPDEGLGFDAVKAGAFEIRDRLDALGLPSWPLLTGGKGVHVVVPLRRTAGWETVSLFSRMLAELCARDAPERYTATMSKAKRKGRIFIDWLRNQRGATAIAPWSLRARAGAPVAVPVTWTELEATDRANLFTLDDALNRDPEATPPPGPVSLSAAVLKRLESRL
ncbi:DNA ligase D [Citreimonas salinaria]|uniref:DNA ligase (ATP) n=1 Tax=Citreimonas salinaria TaxID=321339 RepID=A0A1H3H7L2_9RHOB|nr:DNA ligase D [Citreimonas salinaria]SDY11441.1 ATP-dependent DNA ligase LigD phosphoesterase module /ATP-dependent DNA ligase LigD polymerase module [Citreimonas salinaria]